MANVRALPMALRSDKNVNETAKLEMPEPSVAAATPLPRTRNGKTSATNIQAIAPKLKAKHAMYTIRHAIAIRPIDEPSAMLWLKAYESEKSATVIPLTPT